MAWTSPKTWTSALVTVSEFNTHIRDNLLALLPGGSGMTAVAHSAGNFTAAGSMSWTVASGDHATFAYVQIDKIMIVTVVLITTTVGGSVSSELRIAIPNSKTAARTMSVGTFAYSDNGTAGTGVASVASSGTYISLYKSLTTPNWTLATDNTAIQGTFIINVN